MLEHIVNVVTDKVYYGLKDFFSQRYDLSEDELIDISIGFVLGYVSALTMVS